MLTLWLTAALAWQSDGCGLALDLPDRPTPVSVPRPASVTAAEGWSWAPVDGVTVSVACATIQEVPEPRGAAEIMAMTADMVRSQLLATEVSRAPFTWHGQPGLAVELRTLAADTPIVLWQVFAGRRHLQVHLVGDRPSIPEAARAVLATARPLAPITEVPPSRRPLTFGPWTSADGVVRAEVPVTHLTADGPAALPPTLRTVATTIAGVSVPFQVASWYAPGHGTFAVRWARLPAALRTGAAQDVLNRVVDGQTAPMRLVDVVRADAPVPGGLRAEVQGRMPIDGGRKLWPSRVRVDVYGDLVVIAVAHGPEGELDPGDVARVMGSLAVAP